MPVTINGTTGIAGVDGSASTPSYQGTDTNTGIFFPAADTIAFGEGGAEVMRINSSGNVGIGTTSPQGPLEVVGVSWFTRNSKSTSLNPDYGSAGTHALITTPTSMALAFATNGDNERMRIDSSGNVGIGTSSPVALLHVAGVPGEIVVSRNTTGTDNNIGSINYYNTNNSTSIATINGRTSGASNSGAITFSTASAGSLTERARITSAGEFVVGKTSTGTGVGTYIDNTGVINTQKSSSANTSTTMEVYSTGASAFRFYVGMGGTIFATSTTITGISDQRLKENIRDLDDGLNSILALKPRKFDWKEGKGKDIKDDRGFVAQEFEQVFPDMIDEWKDPAPEGEEPYKSVRADLIPVLVKAIQDLKAITDAQATRIEALEAEVAALKGAK